MLRSWYVNETLMTFLQYYHYPNLKCISWQIIFQNQIEIEINQFLWKVFNVMIELLNEFKITNSSIVCYLVYQNSKKHINNCLLAACWWNIVIFYFATLWLTYWFSILFNVYWNSIFDFISDSIWRLYYIQLKT